MPLPAFILVLVLVLVMVWWWSLEVLDVDALVPTHSQIVSNYLVGEKFFLKKNIPGHNADVSQVCWCLLPVHK